MKPLQFLQARYCGAGPLWSLDSANLVYGDDTSSVFVFTISKPRGLGRTRKLMAAGFVEPEPGVDQCCIWEKQMGYAEAMEEAAALEGPPVSARRLQRAALSAWEDASAAFHATPSQRAHDYAASFYGLAHSPEMCAAIVAHLPNGEKNR